MRWVSIQSLARELGGECRQGEARVCSATLDSRQVGDGDLFIALSGESTDGHQYIDAAARAGASAAMVSHFVDSSLPQWRVTDPRRSLVELACRARAESRATVAGVTGSNGKTTVKEMLASILAGLGPTRATAGNQNNELGVPLTLCALDPEDRHAVVEMGCGRPGDIELLASWARPSVGVINNVGPAHLGGFGSLEAIARCKGELLAALPANGQAIINADDVFAHIWEQQAAHCHIVRFSLADAPAEVSGRPGPDGDLEIRLPDTAPFRVQVPLPGSHNQANAMAAAAAAHAMGAGTDAIRSGLEAITPVAGRMVTRAGINDATVIDDSYNANPASLAAAMRTLADGSAPLWVVLGDMAELGPRTEAYHADAGRIARQLGIARLYGLGAHSKRAVESFGGPIEGRAFDSRADLVRALQADLEPGVRVLVKGSRSARMDSVVDELVVGSGEEGPSCS